jgi:hypothetical protein
MGPYAKEIEEKERKMQEITNNTTNRDNRKYNKNMTHTIGGIKVTMVTSAEESVEKSVGDSSS